MTVADAGLTIVDAAEPFSFRAFSVRNVAAVDWATAALAWPLNQLAALH